MDAKNRDSRLKKIYREVDRYERVSKSESLVEQDKIRNNREKKISDKSKNKKWVPRAIVKHTCTKEEFCKTKRFISNRVRMCKLKRLGSR